MTPMRGTGSASRSPKVFRGRSIARRRILTGLVTLPLLGIRAVRAADDLRYFRIGTAATTGTYFQIGGMLANAISKPPGSRDCDRGGSCGVPGLIAVAQATQGSVENVQAVGAGRLESALAQSDVAHWAVNGTGLFKGKPPIKTLRVIARLAAELPLRIVPTFLGAHEIPLDHRGSSADRARYVETVIHEMIPAVARGRLARFADVFCETGVYTVDESRAILTAARHAGLLLKLHADELTSCGGAELAASIAATSADHLAAVSDDGIAA